MESLRLTILHVKIHLSNSPVRAWSYILFFFALLAYTKYEFVFLSGKYAKFVRSPKMCVVSCSSFGIGMHGPLTEMTQKYSTDRVDGERFFGSDVSLGCDM